MTDWTSPPGSIGSLLKIVEAACLAAESATSLVAIMYSLVVKSNPSYATTAKRRGITTTHLTETELTTVLLQDQFFPYLFLQQIVCGMNILGSAGENERLFLKYCIRCIEESWYISFYGGVSSVYSDRNAGGI